MVLRETPPPAADNEVAPQAEDDDALRKRLLSRIAVAGVAIVGLLGGLAVYDSMNRPQPPAMPPMAAAPAEPAPTAAAAAPIAVDEKAPAEASATADKGDEATDKEPADAAATAAAVTEKTEAPVGGPVVEAPLKPAKPLTPPATARPAAIKPSAPASAPVRPDPQRELAEAVPEETTAAHAPPAPPAASKHAPPSRPLSRMADSARRFLVQVGVFSNHANAEELVARLNAAGIPAQIESRVQVGPFASRLEADAARAKLKAMGLDEGLLVRR